MRFQEPPLSQKSFILVAVPLAFELLFVLVLFLLLQWYQQQLDGERHARDLTSHLNQILRLLMQEGTNAVSQKISINPLKQSITRRELDTKIKAETEATKELVTGYPEEEAAFSRSTRC